MPGPGCLDYVYAGIRSVRSLSIPILSVAAVDRGAALFLFRHLDNAPLSNATPG
jgi:hypothetical protein